MIACRCGGVENARLCKQCRDVVIELDSADPLPNGTRVRVVAEHHPKADGGYITERKPGGYLVQHDDGYTYGWARHELEVVHAPGEA